MPDFAEELLAAVRHGLQQAVKEKMCSGHYGSPLDKLLTGILDQHGCGIKDLLTTAIASAMSDEGFRKEIASAVRHKLAKTLIERFGGEMEKQINMLKSDPATRARITLAIEEVVKSASK